jgi:hypothetical protein
MEASNRLRPRGKARFYSKAQHKVRPKDNSLSRRAFRLLALTSCQQLRRGSHTGVIKARLHRVER